MKEQITQIEARLRELEKITETFASNKDTQELLRIIHGPGWTTPPEAQLVLALTEATLANVKQAAHTRQELLKCAKIVGTHTTAGVN